MRRRPPRTLRTANLFPYTTRFRAAIPRGARTVALDEDGKQLTSRAFAERLGRWQDDGIPDVAFLIGGADGLSEPVRQAADAILSLGRLTWPHMLVRGLLAAQLFRAESRSEEHTSELQSLMRISYAVFCLQNK